MAKLDDEDGRRAYLAVCTELVTSKSIPLTSTRVSRAAGALEISRRITQLAPVGTALLAVRMMRVAALLYVSIADYQRLAEMGLDVSRAASSPTSSTRSVACSARRRRRSRGSRRA